MLSQRRDARSNRLYCVRGLSRRGQPDRWRLRDRRVQTRCRGGWLEHGYRAGERTPSKRIKRCSLPRPRAMKLSPRPGPRSRTRSKGSPSKARMPRFSSLVRGDGPLWARAPKRNTKALKPSLAAHSQQPVSIPTARLGQQAVKARLNNTPMRFLLFCWGPRPRFDQHL